MKIIGYIIVVLLMLFFYTKAPFDDMVAEEKHLEILIDLDRKNLTKLFEGPELYGVRGIKASFNGIRSNIRPINYQDRDKTLLIDLGKRYFEGNNEILLSQNRAIQNFYDEVAVLIENNKIFWPVSSVVNTKFTGNINQKFVRFCPIKKESIEYGEHKYIQILNLSGTTGEIEIDVSDQLNIIEFDCYKINYLSLALLNRFMETTQLKMLGPEAIKIIPNPATNELEFAPNYHLFSPNGYLGWPQYQHLLKNKLTVEWDNIAKMDIDQLIKQENNKATTLKDSTILKGTVNLDEDLKIGQDEVLLIKAGTDIFLHETANILVESGAILALGSEENPIRIYGKDRNSIYIRDCKKAKLSNVFFEGLTAYTNQCIQLPSAVTAYNSNITIDHCSFNNNKLGDDYLNIVSSTFSLNHVTFSNVLSDAFDSDFSDGTVTNSIFKNIGNDGLDFSSSEVVLEKISFQNVKDKAISGGERSFIQAKNISISDSEIGFVSKDGSELKLLEKISLINNKLDFAVFRKKKFYANPSLIMDSEILGGSTYLFQIESNVLPIDSSIVFVENVEDKLYGNEYGKASR